MKRLQLLATTVLVSIGVALTYFYFEAAVHHSIDLIWDDWLNTDERRWMVVPVCVVMTLLFFWLQHRLDPQADKKESHGLGDMPTPTLANFAKVLFIGFWSLVAGASLGPEAILVPACMVIGGYAGAKLFKADKQAIKLLGAIAFIALMAAFFHAFIAGMLGLLLIKKQSKARLNPGIVILAAVASGVTVWILGFLDSPSFVSLPHTSWQFDIRSLLALLILLAAGYGLTFGISYAHSGIDKLNGHIAKREWWQRGLVAAAGLSALYLLGGSLVEFTGNKSIVPMLQQAAELGALGLAWLVIVKVAAISWSKAMGYRGGLIFPTVFVAAVLVAIAEIYVHDLNFIYGLIAVMAGALAADRKANILV